MQIEHNKWCCIVKVNNNNIAYADIIIILCHNPIIKIEKANILIEKNPENSDAKFIKARSLINLKKPQIALDVLNSIDEESKNSPMYIFLSFLAYKILVEENTSHYNESMLNLYSEKMKNVNLESIDKSEIISYIAE